VFSLAVFGLQHWWTDSSQLILSLFYANLSGTLVILAGSIVFNTFNMNDAAWSLLPILNSTYFLMNAPGPQTFVKLLPFCLLNIWAVRLTFNLFSGVNNLYHEDWRYKMFREQWRYAYFLIGYISFILMPAVLVFFGGLPLYYVLNAVNLKPTNLYLLGVLVVMNAIFFESIADYQLRKTINNKKSEDKNLPCMDRGLWSLCRHPNYFGEITFWLGLWIIGLSTDLNLLSDYFYWAVFLFGAFGVFVIIYFGSMPMMEERQLKRRTEFYTNYMRRVPYKILPLNF
jgi:steroid 5-alpha reductase family enzyme